MDHLANTAPPTSAGYQPWFTCHEIYKVTNTEDPCPPVLENIPGRGHRFSSAGGATQNGVGSLADALCPACHVLAHYRSWGQFDSDQNSLTSHASPVDLLESVSDHSPLLVEKAVCSSQLSEQEGKWFAFSNWLSKVRTLPDGLWACVWNIENRHNNTHEKDMRSRGRLPRK